MHHWNDLLVEIQEKKENKKKYQAYKDISQLKPKPKRQSLVKQRKMYFLAGALAGHYLTHREAECMLYLLRGYTIINTAVKLQLSHRTVEYYVKNMKLKLGVRTKTELVILIMQAGFKY